MKLPLLTGVVMPCPLKLDRTMAKGGKVRIYPEVFRRILEEHFGGTVEELAEVVRYGDFGETEEERREFFASLIREGGMLTVEQVEKLSRKIGIAILAFYLRDPEVIPSKKRRKDNRAGRGEISYKDRMWLRNAEIIQEILEDIVGEGREIQIPLEEGALEDPSGSRLAEELRRVLDFSPEPGSDSIEVFQYIRERVELLGIPVFRLPIDAKNIRGSVIHGRIPVIVVSSSDFPSAQSFTLIHELCHIIQRDVDDDVVELCDAGDEPGVNMREAFCNRVAGKFLLPNWIVEEEYRGFIASRRGEMGEFVSYVSRKYGVSRGVVYNRLVESALIGRDEYERYMEEYRKREWRPYIKGKPGKRDYGKLILNRYGRFALSRLMEAYREKRIDSSSLVHVLKLGKDDRIAEVEGALYSGV